jgi:hypothetical protein
VSDAAAKLRRARTLNDHDARLLEKFVDEVSESIEDYITFLPETEASLWSGYSKDWLRQQFPRWERDGHAKLREQRQARSPLPAVHPAAARQRRSCSS